MTRSRRVFAFVAMAASVAGATAARAEPPRWRSVGPGGGFVTVLAADPNEAARVWAATAAGVYASEDAGRTWERRCQGLETAFISSLEADSRVAGRVYVGTSDRGVFRSDDAGHTWRPARQGLPLNRWGDYYAVTSISAAGGTTLYAAARDGYVYASADGGGTWTRRSREAVYFDHVAADPAFPGWVIGAGSGVWVSVDAGATFAPASGIGEDTVLELAFFGVPVPAWALTSDGVFASRDGGFTWVRSETGLDEVAPLWALGGWGFARDAGTGDVFLATSAGLLRWPAHGSRWELANSQARPARIPGYGYSFEAGYAVAGSVHLLGSYDAGVMRCAATEGPCETGSAGLAGRSVPTFAVSAGRAPSIFVPGGQGDLLRLATGDPEWREIGIAGDTEKIWSVAAATDGSGRVYSSDTRGLYASEDGGESWELRSTVPRSMHGMAVAPSDSEVLLVWDFYQLLGSDDGGRTWSSLTGPTLNGSGAGFDPRDASIVYVGDRNGIRRSDDGGVTWSSATPSGLPLCSSAGTVCQILQLAVSPWAPGTVLVATDGVYVSRDGARTWQAAPLEVGWTYGVAFDPLRPGRMLAVTASEGVWESLDDGATWHRLDEGLAPPPGIVALQVVPAAGGGSMMAIATAAGVYVLEEPAPPTRAPRRRAR